MKKCCVAIKNLYQPSEDARLQLSADYFMSRHPTISAIPLEFRHYAIA